MSLHVNDGLASSARANTPAASGAAADVPDAVMLYNAFGREAMLEALCTSLDEMPKEVLEQLAGKVKHYGECAICTETTDVLLLECEHTFCESCLQGQLNSRWPGFRVAFAYLHCALCRVPLAHKRLVNALEEHLHLWDKVLAIAEEKYRADGFCDSYLGQSPEEVRARAGEEMAVYMCFECGKPYCGGRVDCAAQLELKASELQCQNCAWRKKALGKRCMVHGHKFAIFKCDSCCAVAVWNCVYNHYCERCHQQAHQDKNYPCPGPDECPLGIFHPPNVSARHGAGNVTSFVIGCLKCAGFEDEVGGSHLQFGDQNQFGYPQRNWASFQSGSDLLAALGEEEIRDRLRSRKETHHLSDDAIEACAERLLLHELGHASPQEHLDILYKGQDEASQAEELGRRLDVVGLSVRGSVRERAAKLWLLREKERGSFDLDDLVEID